MNPRRETLYRCPVCDTVVEVLDKVGLELSCCGPAMAPLEAQTDQPGADGHAPVAQWEQGELRVTVGDPRHAMHPDHRIEWIELVADGACFRHFCKPGQDPEAVFDVRSLEGPLTVRAYCSLHGLWSSAVAAEQGAWGREGRSSFCAETAHTVA